MEPLNESLQTIRDFIRWTLAEFNRTELFYGHGTDNPLDEAIALVISVTEIPFDRLDYFLDAKITRAEAQSIVDLSVQRISTRTPLPYLTGTAWFCGLQFKIDARALIPRSPFAEIIANGFEFWFGERPINQALDLCTGSGCIAIALAHYLPMAHVDAVDISSEALALAADNCEMHSVSTRVCLLQSDLMSALETAKYDLIISNPPYVDQIEIDSMPAEFRHEPNLALAAGDDGLEIIMRILKEAPKYMTEGAFLFAEVGVSCDALEKKIPSMPLEWLDFDHGGEGVFVVSREQLIANQHLFEGPSDGE